MAHRDDIVAHLDDRLEPERFDDHAPNGLQVAGDPEVTTVVTGVSASLELLDRALGEDADMLLVHHGMFWDGEDPRVVGPKRAKLERMLDAGVSLVAYHLPLDAHRELGNNWPAARELGLEDLEPWADHGGEPIGVRGRFPEPVPAGELLDRLGTYYGQEVLAFDAGPDEVETLHLVSGAAESDARVAAREGADCFVTGEVKEWCMRHAREWGYHYVSAGHHATERLGVRLLADELEDAFPDVNARFVDVPNPV